MALSDEANAEREREFKKLCEEIGGALITWQYVEEAHFKLFLKMLGAPKAEIASVIYYSIESFESRHTIVGRMAQVFLTEKKDRSVWANETGGLQKELKDANQNRNKLAHYGALFAIENTSENPDGSQTFDFKDPRLQPSSFNLVSRLLGRTPDKDEHNLSSAEIRQYTYDFRLLALRLEGFARGLPLRPQQGLGRLSAVAPQIEWLFQSPPRSTESPPEDDPPSDR